MHERREVVAGHNRALCRQMPDEIGMDVIRNVIQIRLNLSRPHRIPAESKKVRGGAAPDPANRKLGERRRPRFGDTDFRIVDVQAPGDLIRVLSDTRRIHHPSY
jgi:hypothetical protein